MEQSRPLGRMSRHLWSRSRLERFVDREMSSTDQDRVRSHLAECVDCETEVAELLGLKEALRSHVGLRGSPEAIARLQSWIKNEMPSVLG